MVIAGEFLERLAQRIERLDHENLKNYLFELIKERKFLMLLLDRIDQGIITFDRHREVTFINKRAKQIFDFMENEAQKATLDEIINDRAVQKIVSDAIVKKKELIQQEIEVLIPRPMILEATLLCESEEKDSWFILLIQNLTQTKLGMREKFKLENWETVMGLASGIAHEIGNPLNSLAIHEKLLAQLLKSERFKGK